MKEILLKNKFFFYPLLFFWLFASFCLFICEKGDVFLFVNQNHSGFLDILFYYATSLGNGYVFLVFACLLLFVQYRYLLILAGAALLQTILVQIPKKLIFSDCMRPLKYFADHSDINLVEGVRVHSWQSFPSGHTATAFCVATLVVLMFKNRKLALFVLLTAFLVACSRIYLAQHFFMDIVAGSFIGVMSAWISYYCFAGRKNAWFSGKSWMHRSLFYNKGK
jgi:membrane-associated phospholipid phosphatase